AAGGASFGERRERRSLLASPAWRPLVRNPTAVPNVRERPQMRRVLSAPGQNRSRRIRDESVGRSVRSYALTQPVTVVPVTVTAPFAKACPKKLPWVRVMAALARIVPRKCESVMVASSATNQKTLHGCPPPASTAEKPVPVRAPVPLVPILKIQIPFAGPASVAWPVNVAAASKQ